MTEQLHGRRESSYCKIRRPGMCHSIGRFNSERPPTEISVNGPSSRTTYSAGLPQQLKLSLTVLSFSLVCSLILRFNLWTELRGHQAPINNCFSSDTAVCVRVMVVAGTILQEMSQQLTLSDDSLQLDDIRVCELAHD